MGTYILSSLFCLWLDPDLLVLHPRHKLQYFVHTKWNPDWIETAKDLVREKWEEVYALLEIEPEDGSEVEEVESSSKVRCYSHQLIHTTDERNYISLTICLITCHPLLHYRSSVLLKMSSKSTLAPLLKTSRMRSLGGMQTATAFCGYHVWPLIT